MVPHDESLPTLREADPQNANRLSSPAHLRFPQTPLDRLLASPASKRGQLKKLLQLRAATNPFQLAEVIETKLQRIARLAARPTLHSSCEKETPRPKKADRSTPSTQRKEIVPLKASQKVVPRSRRTGTPRTGIRSSTLPRCGVTRVRKSNDSTKPPRVRKSNGSTDHRVHSRSCAIPTNTPAIPCRAEITPYAGSPLVVRGSV